MSRIAWFVSSHGFGHAARASAVMGEWAIHWPDWEVELVSESPSWFFEESLNLPFQLYHEKIDVGFVQRGPLQIDFAATVTQLQDFFDNLPSRVELLAQRLEGCQAVICDVAPLGILVAKKLGIPSILIENFTWDWLYRELADRHPQLGEFALPLEQIYAQADLRIQTRPFCHNHPQAPKVDPLARPLSPQAHLLAQSLGLEGERPIITITMGGHDFYPEFVEQLKKKEQYQFVLTGQGGSLRHQGNCLFLPPSSKVYHPDLINLSDGVIGKVGYSTMAECHQAGTPFGYIARMDFPESPLLCQFIETNMNGLALDPASFALGGWLEELPLLLEQQSFGPGQGGRGEVVSLIESLLS